MRKHRTRLLTYGLIVAMLPFQAPFAHAEGQFATSETVVNGQGGLMVLSLGTSNELEVSSDDDDPVSISFNGALLAQNSEQVIPVTVTITDTGDREPPTVAAFAEATGRAELFNQATFRSDIAEIEVEKTIYLVSASDSDQMGSITITDDPAPLVVGWLTFASILSFTGLSAYALHVCERIEIGGSADLLERRGEASIVCVKPG